MAVHTAVQLDLHRKRPSSKILRKRFRIRRAEHGKRKVGLGGCGGGARRYVAEDEDIRPRQGGAEGKPLLNRRDGKATAPRRREGGRHRDGAVAVGIRLDDRDRLGAAARKAVTQKAKIRDKAVKVHKQARPPRHAPRKIRIHHTPTPYPYSI